MGDINTVCNGDFNLGALSQPFLSGQMNNKPGGPFPTIIVGPDIVKSMHKLKVTPQLELQVLQMQPVGFEHRTRLP